MIAIDLPGHGQSSHRHHCTRYHLLDNVDDVKKIVDSKKIDSIIKYHIVYNHFVISVSSLQL